MPPTAAPKPAPEQPAPEIFLSPRVVDAAAFEQFAGALRSLVGQATEHEQALQGRLSRSEAVLRQLTQAAPAVESKLSLATGTISTIDQRLDELHARVEQELTRLSAAERDGAGGLDRLDRAINDRVAEAQTRLAAMVEQATGRVLAAAAEASGAAHDAAERARAEIERARSVVHAARTEYEDSLASWRERIAPLTEQAALETANLESRLRAIEDRTSTFAGPGLKSLSVLCGRAAVLLGRDPDAEPGPASPGSLGELVARAERLGESTEFATRQLDAIRGEAEAARAILATTLDASAQTIDGISQRQRSLGEALLDALRTAEEARDMLETRARMFLDAIEHAGTAHPAGHATPPPAPGPNPAPVSPKPRARRGRTPGFAEEL